MGAPTKFRAVGCVITKPLGYESCYVAAILQAGQPIDLTDEDRQYLAAIGEKRAELADQLPLMVASIHEYWHGKSQPPLTRFKVGRNDLCPCGSGKKHKRCCGAN